MHLDKRRLRLNRRHPGKEVGLPQKKVSAQDVVGHHARRRVNHLCFKNFSAYRVALQLLTERCQPQIAKSSFRCKLRGINVTRELVIAGEVCLMSSQEISQLEVMQQLVGRRISQRLVAERQKMTTPQVRRLQVRFRKGGAPALVSR